MGASRTLTVCFDVDGTLLDYESNPREDIVMLLKAVARNKSNRVVVWSGGGKQYAEVIARRLGIDSIIFDCWSKLNPQFPVDIAIDDEEVKLGKYNIRV